MNCLQTILVEGFDCFWLGAPSERCQWASDVAEKIFAWLEPIRRSKKGREFNEEDLQALDDLLK